MTEENPLDRMMREMQKLLQQIDAHSHQIFDTPLPFEIEKKIDLWQKAVQVLVGEINTIVKQTGIPAQTIREVKEEIPKTLPSDERESLKRIKKLKENIEQQKEAFNKRVLEFQSQELEEKKEDVPQPPLERTKPLKRKSKFKGMGGDTWKQI